MAFNVISGDVANKAMSSPVYQRLLMVIPPILNPQDITIYTVFKKKFTPMTFMITM